MARVVHRASLARRVPKDRKASEAQKVIPDRPVLWGHQDQSDRSALKVIRESAGPRDLRARQRSPRQLFVCRSKNALPAADVLRIAAVTSSP